MPLSVRPLLVALLVLASLLLPAGAAHADSSSPRLQAAERASAKEVGGGVPVAVSWSATDQEEPGSGVSSVSFSYENVRPDGRLIGWHTVSGKHQPLPDGRSVAVNALTPWAAQGHYALVRISVWDVIGNITTYHRDGSVTTLHGTDVPPPAAVDFASLDFDVLNPLSDTAVPTLEGLAPVSRVVRAGEPVVLTSRAADDVAGTAALSVRYRSPSGVTYVHATADPVLAAAGLASAVLPLGAEGGTWQATVVAVEDRAGNSVYYDRSGSPPTYRPSGVRPHAAQTPLDLASLDIDVVAGTPDAAGPTLTELRREGPAELRREDDAVLSFNAYDESGLAFIHFQYYDRNSHSFWVGSHCLREGAGRAVHQVPAGLDLGAVQLSSVLVVDEVGNARTYRRDGTVWTGGQTEPDAVPGLDLSRLDFELVEGPATFTGHPPTTSDCPWIPQLPLVLPETAGPGEVVQVAGQVLTEHSGPLPQAQVAVFAEPEGQLPELVSLASTESDGSYSLTHVMSGDDTTYRVRFLGRGGPEGAEPTTGAPGLVRVERAEPQPDPEPDPEPDLETDPDTAREPVVRLAGADRIDTAVTVSQASVEAGAAGAVVLTRSDDYADAIAGTPLAARQGGPLLLTPGGHLDLRVEREMRRVLAPGGTVYLLGGQKAVTQAVEQAVRDAGYNAVRLAGADRYATATAIAARVTSAPKAVLLATGRSFADALSAGAAAASVGGVVVLTDDHRLPVASSTYLAQQQSTPRYAVGGPAAAADPRATALSGRDRYETALLTARRFSGGAGQLGIATGEVYADALAGGAHAARSGAALLLTPQDRFPAGLEDYLSQSGVRQVFVYGGPGAVSDAVMTRLQRLIP